MQAADDCVFCRLIAGELEASVVYQDRRSVALMDIQPVTSGHVLVMPRTHGPSLADLDPDDGAQMFRVAQLAAAALWHSGLRCEGVNLFLADGAAAGQDVFHVHLHVFPRFEGDGFGLRLPPDYEVRPRAELDAAASALREAWPGHGDLATTQRYIDLAGVSFRDEALIAEQRMFGVESRVETQPAPTPKTPV